MTQADRDRLVTLKKAKRRLITQAQAAEELGLSVRQVKRLIKALKKQGDKAVIHGLRGQPSKRKIPEPVKRKAVKILCGQEYEGFGPTLASEYLAEAHSIGVSRETLRGWMKEAGLWKTRRQPLKKIHLYRPRRSRLGELVQWDSSEHDWLEGRGEKIYLISMIDDATSRLHARFARHDSTEENMRLLWSYVLRYGRPAAFYTDKASLFRTAEKRRRDEPGVDKDAVEMPPTQIGRALRELNVAWIAAHSPQAKGRVERSFQTAQDRLVKGLRLAGAKTGEQSNAYLESTFLPWWERTRTVQAAHADDAHRKLDRGHDLAAILSHVETRQVRNDYTIQFECGWYQIGRESIVSGLRGAAVRVEKRLDGSVAVRFGERYLAVTLVGSKPSPALANNQTNTAQKPRAKAKSKWMDGFLRKPGPSLKKAIVIANATS